jgi:hypothetical protein
LQSYCQGSALLPYGQVTFAGAGLDNQLLVAAPGTSTTPGPDADQTLAITGGTGSYRAAAGILTIHPLVAAQQDWSFTFSAQR